MPEPAQPTTDEKIQLLVRSVLEAVDARLEAVRSSVTALEQRIAALEHTPPPVLVPAAPVPAAPPPPPPPAVDELHIPALDVLPPTIDLDRISKPLVVQGHITTQVPIVPEPQPIAVPDHRSAADAASDAAIDLDRLSALLSERLGHLSLPTIEHSDSEASTR